MAAHLTCENETIGEERYEILGHLGEGSYGEVVMAVDRELGSLVALKKVKKERTRLEAFLHEVCMSLFVTGHEGIISTHSRILENSDCYMISQELAPAGSLHSIIQPGMGIPEKLVKRCALQLTQALEYMHSKNLVHRDLKPDNILLMDKRCHNVKLSDFGLTQFAGTVVPSMAPLNTFMSPELCELEHRESIVVDPSVDIWALGIVLYVLLTGNYPWETASAQDLWFQRFIYWQNNSDHVPPPSGWENVSRRAQDLFHILLAQDPSCRNQVRVVLDFLHFPWNFEVATQETMDLVEQKEEEDIAAKDSEVEVIVLESEEEIIIIENHGDIEYIVINYSGS